MLKCSRKTIRFDCLLSNFPIARVNIDKGKLRAVLIGFLLMVLNSLVGIEIPLDRFWYRNVNKFAGNLINSLESKIHACCFQDFIGNVSSLFGGHIVGFLQVNLCVGF